MIPCVPVLFLLFLTLRGSEFCITVTLDQFHYADAIVDAECYIGPSLKLV